MTLNPCNLSNTPAFDMNQDRLAQLLAFYEEDPEDAFTQFAIAQEYRKRGEIDEALSFYERLVKEQPAYVGTYYHLGKLYEQLDRPDEAEATYQRGIEAAQEQRDHHAQAELRDALLKVQGVGFEDEDEL